MAIDYNSSVDYPDQDVAYMNILSVDQADAFQDRKTWLIDSGRISQALDELTIPSSGKIIEVGIWEGDIYEQLKTYFGADRCLGFDIYDYLNNDDSSVTIGDFRTIHSDHNQDCAVVFNGAGGWDTNTSSKQAVLDYAYANLVSGGYYLDSKFLWDFSSPDMSSYTDFTEVENEVFKVFVKA